jgi:hypothetical protein
MNELSSLILKQGIKDLLLEEDSAFKKSLTDCLSLKLNYALSEVNEQLHNNFFNKTEITESNEDLNYFIEFIEKYDSKFNNRLKLKNESYININESDFEALTKLFDSLSPKNRKFMLEEILQTPHKLKKHLEFYRNAQTICK